ncbi:hypothetical protein AgCh_004136 [Apium graveolens]
MEKGVKFAVYRNPALSAALNTRSLRPSKYTFLFILSLSTASAFSLLSLITRENGVIDSLKLGFFSQGVAYFFAKAMQILLGVLLIGTMVALAKAVSMRRMKISTGVTVDSQSKGPDEQMHLTNRQLGLLGIKPKNEQVVSGLSNKPSKTKSSQASPSSLLFPLHQPMINSSRSSRGSSDKSNSSSGSKFHSFSTPTKSPASQSLFLMNVPATQSLSVSNSPGPDQLVASPWSKKRASATKEITTEEEFEQFLADIDEKFSESASKLATPPATSNGFGIATPNTISSSTNTSGTTRSTPLRPVRMSPGSQKFSTPPKKGEGDLPPPMSMEESIQAYEHLGIYPEIEQWRDRLRQWFSSVLLNPLLTKIENSHIKVMQSAAKLNISVTISQVGTDLPSSGTTTAASSMKRTNEWQPAASVDEEGLLHQLRAALVQALDASMQLAEGTCVKNYEYLGSGEVYDKVNKKWTLELPTDSHLLLYLFCAFLEHPSWMLHVDPTPYAGAQSSKNPLFLGVLPPKERFPEKYLAAVSGVPSVLHPGASVLAVGKQSPPIFSLYWDKKAQFSLQGRPAMWDSILLLCHRIKIAYGGIVRGVHLGSSALDILSILDEDDEN